MNEHSVNEFLAFFFRDARTSRVRLLRIAEHLERQFPYTVCDSWLSPRGHVGLLNLSTAAHSGALDGSESIGSKTSVLPANGVRECPSFAWLRAGYCTTPTRRWESAVRVDAGQLLPVHPLVDEKVVRVISNMPLPLLVSESLAFATTCSLAPALRRVPLFAARYRFEKRWPGRHDPCGFRARAPIQPGPSTYVKRELIKAGALADLICAHIRAGRLRDEIRDATTPAVWRVIENPRAAQLEATGVPRTPLSQYLWICFQASLLHSSV